MTPLPVQAPVKAPPRRVVPRDAASLILIDRSGPAMRVLVGRRAAAHRFMPDVYVFPGGRRDRLDHRVDTLDRLPDPVVAALSRRVAHRRIAAVAGGLAVTALRELFEETGLRIGGEAGLPGEFRPAVGKLRYAARAITPPGFPMRFDTRFFALFADEADIDPRAARDSRELEDVRWIDVDDRQSVNLPAITTTILDDLVARLAIDPNLSFKPDVPFYYTVRGRFIRTLL